FPALKRTDPDQSGPVHTRVSSEGFDVPADPGDGSVLIPQPTWQSGVSGAEEAQSTNPVVHRDDNDSAPVSHLLPVVQRVSEDRHVIRRPQQEGATKQVDHHR
ncbi:hypothetical protein INR49_021211, partial [Caranx melampygus]